MSAAVKVAIYPTQTEAVIAAEYLRANGIVVTVMGENAGGAFSGLTLSKGFEIYVPNEDEALAIELLENPPEPDEQTGESNQAEY